MNNYRAVIISGVLNYTFDHAVLEETKKSIIEKVDLIIAEWDKRGERLYALMYFTVAREGMQQAQFNPPEPRDYMIILDEVVKRWDKDPDFRKYYAVIECLKGVK